MSTDLARVYLYSLASAWNIFWGAPLLVAPDFANAMLGLVPPAGGLAELHARGAGLAIVLFGLVYFTIGTAPRTFRPFLGIAIVAKIAFFTLVLAIFLRHRELLPMLIVAIGDLAFGVFFWRDWMRLR